MSKKRVDKTMGAPSYGTDTARSPAMMPAGVDSDQNRPPFTRANAPSADTTLCSNAPIADAPGLLNAPNADSLHHSNAPNADAAGHSKFKTKVKNLFSKKSSKSLRADALNAAMTTTPDVPILTKMGQAPSQHSFSMANIEGATYIRRPKRMNRARRPANLALPWIPGSKWTLIPQGPSKWILVRAGLPDDRDKKLSLLQPEEYCVQEPNRPKLEKPPHTSWSLKAKISYKWDQDLQRVEPVWKDEPQAGIIRKVAVQMFRATGFDLNGQLVRVGPHSQSTWMHRWIVQVINVDTRNWREYLVCYCLPNFPRYKLQSVVATMMYVKESTNIPVPRVIGHDCNLKNPLGLEYMMIENVPGWQYGAAEKDLSFEAKKTFARSLANIVDQLSNLAFSDIGSLYRDFKRPDGDSTSYFVDVITEPHMTRDMRVDYNVPRGPYRSLHDFYAAQIAVLKSEANDPRQKARLDYWFRSQEEGEQKIKDDSTRKALIERKLQSRADDEEGPWDFLPAPKYTHNDAELLPTFCDALQNILHLLTSSKELLPGETRLFHFNLSKWNVLINRSGEITGILDWEDAWVAPPELIQKYPPCLPNLDEENIEPLLDYTTEDDDGDKEGKWEDLMLAMEYEDRLQELRSSHLDVLRIERNPQLGKMEQFLRKIPSMETFMKFLDDVDSSRKAEKKEAETWL